MALRVSLLHREAPGVPSGPPTPFPGPPATPRPGPPQVPASGPARGGRATGTHLSAILSASGTVQTPTAPLGGSGARQRFSAAATGSLSAASRVLCKEPSLWKRFRCAHAHTVRVRVTCPRQYSPAPCSPPLGAAPRWGGIPSILALDPALATGQPISVGMAS